MGGHQAPERPATFPRAYFITFTCYGTKLHGDPQGSVDRDHNAWRTPLLSEDTERVRRERLRMVHDGYLLDSSARLVVLRAIRKHCLVQEWTLHVAHVRSNHVHAVVTAEERPEVVMGQFKAYASRALNQASGLRRKRWSHHASTKYLWNWKSVASAVAYVREQQGKPMALYVNPTPWPTR